MLLEPGEEVVELVELGRIDGQRIGGLAVQKVVFEVMETDRVVAEPFRLVDEVVDMLAAEVVAEPTRFGPKSRIRFPGAFSNVR